MMPAFLPAFRRLLFPSLVAVALAAAACAEAPFERTNPNDLKSDYDIAIDFDGDTIDGTNARFRMGVIGTPPLHERFALAARWDFEPQVISRIQGDSFVTFATMRPTPVVVEARIGSHATQREVVVRQRAGDWTFRCPANPCSPVPGVGQNFAVEVSGQTADARLPRDVRWAIANATITIRSPAIVELLQQPAAGSGDYFVMRSLASGSSWVVFEYDGVRDSLLVTVN